MRCGVQRRDAETPRKPALRLTQRLCVAAFISVACLQAQTLERAESLWKLHNYDAANTAFRDLVKTHPKNADYRVRWGRLFLERFNPAEAAKLFGEAITIKKDHPGALLGLALVAADGFEAKAVEYAEQALAADPKLIEARVLLARLALEDNDPKKAAEEADKALAIAPQALDAMAIHASIDWLDDKDDKDEKSGRSWRAFAPTAKPSRSSRIYGARTRSSALT